MIKRNGSALLSVLAVTAIALVLVSSLTLVTVINARTSLGFHQSERSYQAVESLLEEMILRFIRFRAVSNPYPDWTENCLQIEDFDCKMEMNLTESGGTIDAWGKMAGKIRHFQVELSVTDQDEVAVETKKEVY